MGKNKQEKRKQNKEKKKRLQEGAAAGEGEIDEETAAQVKEIEERLADISQELKQAEEKNKMYIFQARRAALTEKQLEDISEDARVYRQAGRAFVMSRKKDIVHSLKAQVAQKEKENKVLKTTEALLQQKLKGEALALRELIGDARMKKMFEGGQARENMDLSSLDGDKSEADAMMPLFALPSKAASKTDGENEEVPSKTDGESDAAHANSTEENVEASTTDD